MNDGEEALLAVRRKVARGASSVALSRLGALVEVVSQPAYTWMFGLPTYGLYMVLWSLVNIGENIFDLGVTSGLQRLLPRTDDPGERARTVRAALLLGILPNLAAATVTCLAAPAIAPLLNVAAGDQARLVTAIRLFAWALPLWATIEVATSAVRACHAFGPEVRVRLFWEQVTRLIAAALLCAAGVGTLGLLLAHLASLTLTAGAALSLLNRYVPLRDILRERAGSAIIADMAASSLSVLPANILGRAFSDVATVLANLLAPGAAGASAAAIYAIARKVASIPQIVRQTFGYVLGPIAAAAARGERATLQSLYDFAVRLSLLLALPTCATLIAAGPAILGLFAKGAQAGLPILVVLTASRGIEATIGPASSIQQVIGSRYYPLLNSAIAIVSSAAVLVITAGQLPEPRRRARGRDRAGDGRGALDRPALARRRPASTTERFAACRADRGCGLRGAARAGQCSSAPLVVAGRGRLCGLAWRALARASSRPAIGRQDGTGSGGTDDPFVMRAKTGTAPLSGACASYSRRRAAENPGAGPGTFTR